MSSADLRPALEEARADRDRLLARNYALETENADLRERLEQFTVASLLWHGRSEFWRAWTMRLVGFLSVILPVWIWQNWFAR